MNPITVLDCDPQERPDCRAVSPEAIQAFGAMIEVNEALMARQEKCDHRKYPQVNNGYSQ